MQKRIFSIDFTRGIVMMIMALDHIRDLLHVSSITGSPTDLSTTTPILFFTRWVTYLCAPIFVFLAGTSVFLAKEGRGELARTRYFILKRGIFLVLIEFTVINFGMFLDAGFHLFLFEVIAAIGFGFMILSGLLSLKPTTILTIGLVILLFHNALDFIPPKTNTASLREFLSFFNPAAIPFSGRVFVMGYPPVPWLGILLLGYGAGPLFRNSPEKRAAWFLRLGVGSLFLFLIGRFLNIFGDPAPWSNQKNGLFTFLSFINVTKYPPSLLFCLVTLGAMFFFLWFGERVSKAWAEVPKTYGQAPLFFFIVHFYLIHVLLLGMLFLQGFHWSQLDFADGTFGRPKGRVSGVPLWAVYVVWPVVVAILYKPCRWFIHYRRTHADSWLRYI